MLKLHVVHEPTISVTLLEYCWYNSTRNIPPSPTRQCCKKRFNQMDQDKFSQHYATLNRGRRGGCSL